MVVDLFATLFDLCDGGFLLHDLCLEILEQLRQLDHVPLDLLNGLMARAHVGRDALGVSSSVGVNQL
jgi:hypothetical protein